MVKFIRCSEYVIDKGTNKRRKCKKKVIYGKKYCHIHDDLFKDWEVGKCCFCLEECNPASQSCGRCARQLWFF